MYARARSRSTHIHAPPAPPRHALQLARLAQLVIGAAVQCEEKESYISVIVELDGDVQISLMALIQEVIDAQVPRAGGDGSDETSRKRLEQMLYAAQLELEELRAANARLQARLEAGGGGSSSSSSA